MSEKDKCIGWEDAKECTEEEFKAFLKHEWKDRNGSYFCEGIEARA